MTAAEGRESAIRVSVDLTNPGQFFACCGLLELVTKFERLATGYFENGHFLINGDVRAALDCFFKCDVKVDNSATFKNDDANDESNDEDDIDSQRGRIYPMVLGDPFNMRLDWWTDEEAQGQKLKTWTAGQRVTDLLLA